MCGIVAMFSSARPISEETMQRATQMLRHRGPDGQRCWIADDRRVALGHARLSIIDLRTGTQPIASEDGRTRIVVNGEFYGYEAIQRELEQSGHRLRTRSDSEIALHLYRDLGPQCLHRLRGEFAMVIWDETNQTLFAARDRFGIKPLFYAWHEGTLYLASEIKALLAAGVPARWDPESFAHSTASGHSEVRTMFDGIVQIPPGHYMLASAGHRRIVRYWDFNYPTITQTRQRRSDADYAAELRHALDEAVSLRLRADVPVACYLSGGLDSCALLGLAAKHRSDPIRAFTLTFDLSEYDEEAQAKEMAAKAGAEFCPIPIRQADLAEHFEDAITQSERPCINAHGVAKYLLSRAVQAAGYKVVLTGEGSDEILGGYAHFRRDMLLYNTEGQDQATVARLLDELGKLNPVSRGILLPHGEAEPLQRIRRLLGFVPTWIEARAAGAAKFRALLAEGFLHRAGTPEPYSSLLDGLDVRSQLLGREPVHQSMYLWSKAVLPAYLLTILGDRMEMAHSIEGRVPYLDHHLVELICSQPVSQKIRGMTEKFVLREAARDVITDTVYRRQKHPFFSPPATLRPHEKLYALVQDKLRGSALASVPFFDRKKVIGLLDRLPAMDEGSRAAYDEVLMAVLSACVLQERFKLTAPVSPD
ncbi:MAG TPA: asparagine synthase (glutamine-hydrolyzing) [Steroidobacteraceae bacterium]|jgi:asparagine synthase (glutamine-hydrolysing)